MLFSPKNTFQAKATHAAGGMEVKILMYNNTAAYHAKNITLPMNAND